MYDRCSTRKESAADAAAADVDDAAGAAFESTFRFFCAFTAVRSVVVVSASLLRRLALAVASAEVEDLLIPS